MAKKSAKGGGTIRQRADGTWEARYTAGRDPGTGKQIQKSVYGKTQKEVRKKLTERLAQIDSGVYMEPSKMTLGEWLDIWLAEYVADSVKPYTVSSYQVQIRNHIKPALGAVKLSALTTPAIQHFYNQLKKPREKSGALSAKTIKNIHGVLHSALKKAAALRYIPYNPSDACELPRIEKKEIQPLNDDSMTAFLKAVRGHKYEILYKVTVFTGMRQGEILGLTWDCVDFESGIITVKQQLQKEPQKGGAYRLVSPKNGKTRTIKPANSVMALLRHRKTRQAVDQLQAGEYWDNPWQLVFTDKTGRHLNRKTVYKQFKAIIAVSTISGTHMPSQPWRQGMM